MKILIEIVPREEEEIDEEFILRAVQSDLTELCFYLSNIKAWGATCVREE